MPDRNSGGLRRRTFPHPRRLADQDAQALRGRRDLQGVIARIHPLREFDAVALDGGRDQLFGQRRGGLVACIVDTLDLYSAKGRGHYLLQAARELGVRDEVIKHDLGRILLKLEALQDERIKAATTTAPAVPAMSDAERDAALAMLR
jgi:hypothetical protein